MEDERIRDTCAFVVLCGRIKGYTNSQSFFQSSHVILNQALSSVLYRIADMVSICETAIPFNTYLANDRMNNSNTKHFLQSVKVSSRPRVLGVTAAPSEYIISSFPLLSSTAHIINPQPFRARSSNLSQTSPRIIVSMAEQQIGLLESQEYSRQTLRFAREQLVMRLRAELERSFDKTEDEFQAETKGRPKYKIDAEDEKPVSLSNDKLKRAKAILSILNSDANQEAPEPIPRHPPQTECKSKWSLVKTLTHVLAKLKTGKR